MIQGGYDAELRRHDEALRRACDIQAGEQVLDIGCGAGHTTRQAALSAASGSALGVDVSALAIESARAQAEREGLRNVAFECADAQTHPFAPTGFDVAISRFGTMFFADPAAAFANIGRALRPGGRLTMMVWQAGERNEWDVAIRGALGAAPGPDAFSLADPPAVNAILRTAGFAAVAFTDVRVPVHYGPDVDTALDWVRGFACTRHVLDGTDRAAAARAEARLREVFAAHLGAGGVEFDSRSWIVTARRPLPSHPS